MIVNELEKKANEIRKLVLSTISRSKAGHIGASLSEVDVLTVLYFHVMNICPDSCNSSQRDRFVLSKGHASEGLYATLTKRGILPAYEMDRYMEHDCPLTIHPTRHVPGVEINTGALGHGFSNAVGMALAAKMAKEPWRVFVMTGDGELQEGSNWEAAMAAAHFKLGNLVLIVDNNGLQLADSVQHTMGLEPLDKKLEAFGFEVHHVDGHSMDNLVRYFDSLGYNGDKPHALIAHTIKGAGVSFMENVPEWHHRIPTMEEAAVAMEALEI